jgi:hypothetical protein
MLIPMVGAVGSHSHQQGTRVLSPQPPQHLLFDFLSVAILAGKSVLICISFTVKDGDHFPVCLSFALLLLRTLCSAPLPIYYLNYLFLWYFIF